MSRFHDTNHLPDQSVTSIFPYFQL
jgi:hypothetical protein